MRNNDTITGLVLLGVCAIAYWLTMGFDEVPAMLSQNVPPTFFPRLVLSIIALLSLALVAKGIGQAPVATTTVPAEFWVTVGIIALAGVLMGLLGILLTLGLVAVALPLAWGERRYPLIGALAVCLPAGIYLIFTLGLGVRFPAGRLLDLLLQS